MFSETPFRTRQVSYLIGAVSVMKTDIKGGGLPHFIREERVGLHQLFPYIIRCKLEKKDLNQNEPKWTKMNQSSKFKEP